MVKTAKLQTPMLPNNTDTAKGRTGIWITQRTCENMKHCHNKQSTM